MSTKNQLSLNLVAISAGGLTFSILLGPLLHIPETVPAVITLTVLGLAALDQFGWQGLGGELFLDGLAQCSPAYRQRLVRHEAGHFLAAHLLGLTPTDYSLSLWQAWRQGQGQQVGVSLTVPPQVTLPELEKYCTVWMAGIAAEEWLYGQAEGGEADRQQVAAIAQTLNINPTLKQRQALLNAKQLLTTHASTYEALVVAMGEQQSASDCRALLEQMQETELVH
jgi:hypothetical protein